MSKFAEPMTRLIDELKKLPGIGRERSLHSMASVPSNFEFKI
jgi:recombinational DNA repair protein RecR